MNEKNTNIAENISLFLMSFQDEVIQGLQKYLAVNTAVSYDIA